MIYRSVRYFFDSLETAVEALLMVLEDARTTNLSYSFGSLSAQQVFSSGLMLVGEVEVICLKLDMLSGATRYEE